jgi:hypothetical protein
MVTINQILAHIIGDYFLQSDWMATLKAKKWMPAICHVLLYILPFLFITQSIWALSVICISHLLIDHFGLAKYFCWAKNFIAPKCIEWSKINKNGLLVSELRRNYPYDLCAESGGYSPNRPIWLTIWLMIIVDNTIHIIINGLAIKYLG